MQSGLKKILSVLLISASTVFSQSRLPECRVNSLSFEEGVSHNLVYSIIQDHYGFMWFGTMYGLVRYDGENYIKHKHDPDDTTSLSNDDIVSIMETANGDLWLGTYTGGINKYVRSSNSFKRFDKEQFNLGDKWDGTVWGMAEDTSGNLWLATHGAGVVKFNEADNDIKHYEFDGSSDNEFRNNSVYGLCYDKPTESIWLVSGGGLLHRFDADSNKFVSYDPFDSQVKPGYAYLTKVVSYNDSTLLLGSNKGPLIFNVSTKQFGKMLFSNNRTKSVGSVQALIPDKDNRLWIGTTRGLYIADVLDKTLKLINTESNDGTIEPVNNVITLAKDKSGIVWAGSYLRGIYKVSPGPFLFKSINTGDAVTALNTFEDKLLIGSKNGLAEYNYLSDEFESKSSFAEQLSGKVITSIEKDDKGSYWLGTAEGVFLYAPSKGVLKHFTYNEQDRNSLSNNFINCITAGSRNNIWVGTGYGLNEYSNSSRTFKRILPGSSSMKGANLLSVFEDSKGDVWFGTFLGLNRLIPSADTILVYRRDAYDPKSISNNYVYDMLEDESGNLWLATAGGLNYFDRSNETFVCYDNNDGLASPVLFGLQKDSSGYIWISSNKGLSRFDPSSKKFINYDTRDGLQSNMFNMSSLKLEDGRLVFGGINGLNIVNPNAEAADKSNYNILLTSLKVFDKDLSDSLDINSLSKLELTYNENFIRVQFASTDYRNPHKIQYRYMLEGIDDNWRMSGYSNSAEYTNLPHGEYKLVIQSKGSSGNWGSKAKTLAIIITPPFWETLWFSMLILFVSLLIVYSLYRRKVKNEIEKRVQLEKIRVAENEKVRRKAADDFHDELGHHITKISLYSEILKQQTNQIGDSAKDYLDKITELTKGLSIGVRDFIWTLDPDKDSLYEVAVRLKDFGDELFDKTGIAFSVEGITEDFSKIKLNVDWRRHLTLMFKEAMNNALKYAGCSEVKLSFNIINRKLKLSLSDNGKGINELVNESGRGLKSLNKRAVNLNSKLQVISNSPSGTEILFEGELK